MQEEIAKKRRLIEEEKLQLQYIKVLLRDNITSPVECVSSAGILDRNCWQSAPGSDGFSRFLRFQSDILLFHPKKTVRSI